MVGYTLGMVLCGSMEKGMDGFRGRLFLRAIFDRRCRYMEKERSLSFIDIFCSRKDRAALPCASYHHYEG